jgi:uracil-DNA glycosylase
MSFDEHLAKLARQHALTTRLMGVDFVPAFRSRQSAASSVADIEEALLPSPVPAPAVVPSPQVQLESKPRPAVRPRPAIQAGTPRTPESSTQALESLKARYIKDAPHAPFIKTFTNIVFGEGDPCARIMFIGEAPGEEEDKTGRPFVGRAGQLLEKMIVAMGLSREAVYICNVLKVRPPNNATPTLEEAAASEPYLFEQIDIVAPEAIVTLGKSATACVLKLADSMGAMRGRWHDLALPTGRVVPVMPTFHPAYLLRSYTEENRKKVWSDLQQVMDRLGAAPRPRGGVALSQE